MGRAVVSRRSVARPRKIDVEPVSVGIAKDDLKEAEVRNDPLDEGNRRRREASAQIVRVVADEREMLEAQRARALVLVPRHLDEVDDGKLPEIEPRPPERKRGTRARPEVEDPSIELDEFFQSMRSDRDVIEPAESHDAAISTGIAPSTRTSSFGSMLTRKPRFPPLMKMRGSSSTDAST